MDDGGKTAVGTTENIKSNKSLGEHFSFAVLSAQL